MEQLELLPEEVLKKLNGRNLEEVAANVLYTNYHGVTNSRRIFPLDIRYGNNEYHKEDQWLLKVWDLDKKAIREYSCKDIHEWKK